MKRRRGGNEDLSSRTLIQVIHEERWGEVRERIRTLGKEALTPEFSVNWSMHHPLTEACLFGAPVDLLRAMLEECPAAAKLLDSNGYLPLHTACGETCNPRTVRLILDAYPKGVKTADNDGMLPLHWVCYTSSPSTPRVVRLLLDAYPQGVKTADNDGLLPLHSLFSADEVSLETCNMLVNAHPEGVKATDSRGGLPLHWATHKDIRLGVLRILIDSYPEGATIRDVFGKLPLHYFAELRAGDVTTRTRKRVQALLEPILKSKEACQVTNKKGETPLDIGAEFNALSLHTCVGLECCAPNVIISVARRHPQQLRLMDEGGNFPLHIAAANPSVNGAQATSCGLQREENASDNSDSGEDSDEANASDGSDSDEVSDDTSGGVSEGEQGEAGNKEDGANDDAEVSEDLIGALVKRYPEATTVMNRDRKFPLVLAIESGKRWDEGVEAILDAAGHVSLIKDESANLYPFMIAATVDTPCLTTVYKLLRRCPELKRYMIN